MGGWAGILGGVLCLLARVDLVPIAACHLTKEGRILFYPAMADRRNMCCSFM